MPKDRSIHKVLVIGSGPIVIGQAARPAAFCGRKASRPSLSIPTPPPL